MSLLFVNGRTEAFPDLRQLLLVHYLLAEDVLDVKDVRDLVDLGGDLRDPDVEPQLGQGAGDPVEQPHLVMGVDVDDRVILRHLIVNLHPGRESRFRFLGQQGGPLFFRDERGDPDLPFQDLPHVVLDALPAVFIGNDETLGRIHLQDVEGLAVGAGVDLGAEDVHAVGGHDPGYHRKEAGDIQGADGKTREPLVYFVDDLRHDPLVIQQQEDSYMFGQDLRLVGEEVTGGHRLQLFLHRHHRVFVAQDLQDLPLYPLHPLAACLQPEVAPLQHLESLLIELLEQKRLPFGPDVGADPLDVGIGQEVEHLQVFALSHLPGKLDDHPFIVEVAALGNVRHQDVVPDQKLQPFGVLPGKPHATGDGRDQRGADIGMPPPFPFTDIVQHDRQEQQFALVHLVGQLGQQRQILFMLPLLEPDDLIHREQRMDVDRIDVIEVVLDLAVDPLELGNEADQELQVVHQLKGLGDPLVGAEDVEKRGIDLLAPPEFVMHQIEVAPDERFHLDVEGNPVLLGVLENLHQPGRLFFNDRLVGDHQLPLDDIKPLPHRTPDEIAEEPPGPFLPHDAAGDQARREMLHLVGVEVVVPHELFHRQGFPLVRIAEELGEFDLGVKGQLVVFAPGEVVELVPDLPEIREGIGAEGKFFLRQHPLDDQLTGLGDLVLDLGHPEGGVDIPQGTLPLLDVRLEDIDRRAVLFAALLQLFQLLPDEGVTPLGEDLGKKHLLI